MSVVIEDGKFGSPDFFADEFVPAIQDFEPTGDAFQVLIGFTSAGLMLQLPSGRVNSLREVVALLFECIRKSASSDVIRLVLPFRLTAMSLLRLQEQLSGCWACARSKEAVLYVSYGTRRAKVDMNINGRLMTVMYVVSRS
jgi:hypothetical protein